MSILYSLPENYLYDKPVNIHVHDPSGNIQKYWRAGVQRLLRLANDRSKDKEIDNEKPTIK